MITGYSRNNQSFICDAIPPNDFSQIPKSYSDGEFDGKIGLNPSHPEEWDYWSGYCQGNREYWCKQKNIELPNDF